MIESDTMGRASTTPRRPSRSAPRGQHIDIVDAVVGIKAPPRGQAAAEQATDSVLRRAGPPTCRWRPAVVYHAHLMTSHGKFTTLTGVAAPLPMVNVDTDMIIPKQFLKTI